MATFFKKFTLFLAFALGAQAPLAAMQKTSTPIQQTRSSWFSWIVGGAAVATVVGYFGYKYWSQRAGMPTSKKIRSRSTSLTEKQSGSSDTTTPSASSYLATLQPIKKIYVDVETQTDAEESFDKPIVLVDQNTRNAMHSTAGSSTPGASQQPSERLEDVMNRISTTKSDGTDYFHFRQAPVYINTHNVIIDAQNVNCKDSDGRTALYLAASLHHESLTKRLIDAKANVNDGWSHRARPEHDLPAYNENPLAGALKHSGNFVMNRPMLPIVRLLVEAKASLPEIQHNGDVVISPHAISCAASLDSDVKLYFSNLKNK